MRRYNTELKRSAVVTTSGAIEISNDVVNETFVDYTEPLTSTGVCSVKSDLRRNSYWTIGNSDDDLDLNDNVEWHLTYLYDTY